MALEPPWPRPLPYTANVIKRLARGWRSWFALLNEWDFRIAIGKLNLLGLPVFLVNDPQLLKQLLVSDVERFPKHPYTLWILEPLIGRAIFSVNGCEWQRQRKLLDQAFKQAELRKVFPGMLAATEAMLQRLKQEPKHAVVDVETEMTMVTADVIVRTILSRPLQEGEAQEIFAAFSRYQRRAARALVLRLLRLPKSIVQRSLKRDAHQIRNWIAPLIHERLEQHLQTPYRESQDLLDCLIEARDPDTETSFSEQELVDQICFLFLAGHETSASALATACWLLALDQDAQARIRQEVEDVDTSVGPESLRQMPFSMAVFQETLRLYPPVSFFIRERDGMPTELRRIDPNKKGQQAERQSKEIHRCPVGALMLISPWVIHRHEQHWPQPQEFRPERFLDSEATTLDQQMAREAWLPYGLGSRKCPGAAFAQQEALLVLAGLVKHYRLLPMEGQQPVWLGRLTLRSLNGVRLKTERLEKNKI